MKKLLRPGTAILVALIAGGLGLALQIWLHTTGIDPGGLYVSSHPADALLLALTALTLLVLLLLAWGFRGSRLPRSGPVACAVGSAAGGASILYVTVQELSAQNGILLLLYAVFGILCAAGMFYSAVIYLRRQRPPFLSWCAITVYLMLHLICQYRLWSVESQRQAYFFPLFASVCLMLTAYHRAALDARTGSLRQYLFFNSAALFFCCLCLCSGQWLFFLGIGVWTAANFAPRIPYAAPRASGSETAPSPAPAGMLLPKNARLCIDRLEQAGFPTYVVGGCVRDALLGITPHDYDMCTAATPEQMHQVFAGFHLLSCGEKHGTVGVVLDGAVYEITTFRAEGDYADGRHPNWVEFVTNIEDDLKRRDFTVCAMAYSPSRGYMDPWDGKTDLKNRVLRAVGDPAQRFQEDALRILRGVRFAVRYGLAPERYTEDAMARLAPLMDGLARERVFDELCKLLPLITASDLKRYARVILQVIPELAPALDFDQHSPHHAYDLFTHIALVTEAVPADLPLRWAALLHDVGKPTAFTLDENDRGHFYGHADISAQMADEILLRLKAPNALREQVVLLIRQHMTPLTASKAALRRQLGKYGEAATRRLLLLQKADFGSKALGIEQDDSAFTQLEAVLDEVLQEQARLTVRDLAINGFDLLELGFVRGPIIGICLQALLRQVQEDTLPNTREALLEAAKQFER